MVRAITAKIGIRRAGAAGILPDGSFTTTSLSTHILGNGAAALTYKKPGSPADRTCQGQQLSCRNPGLHGASLSTVDRHARQGFRADAQVEDQRFKGSLRPACVPAN